MQSFLDNYFMCPITRELPKDPVLAADGYMYERGAIEQWFQQSAKSLITNKRFSTHLTGSVGLRKLSADVTKDDVGGISVWGWLCCVPIRWHTSDSNDDFLSSKFLLSTAPGVVQQLEKTTHTLVLMKIPKGVCHENGHGKGDGRHRQEENIHSSLHRRSADKVPGKTFVLCFDSSPGARRISEFE